MDTRYTHTNAEAGMVASSLLAGMALGAAAAFVLDPRGGRARRAFAAQKMRRAARRSALAVRGARKDLANRSRGIIAEARSAIRARSESVDDEQLAARIRSRMGHAITHPGAVVVAAVDGCVLLAGDILASEMDGLIDTVKSVPGVVAIEQNLNRYTDPSHVPSLQGGRSFAGSGRGRLPGFSRGLGSLLTLAAGGAAVYGAVRLLNLDLGAVTDRLMDAVAPPVKEEDFAEFDDLDAAERTGQLPEWVEIRGSVLTNRFF